MNAKQKMRMLSLPAMMRVGVCSARAPRVASFCLALIIPLVASTTTSAVAMSTSGTLRFSASHRGQIRRATTNCAGAENNRNFLYEAYSPGSSHTLSGSRSPITLRTSGTVCYSDGFASPWVSVQSQDLNGGIAQIGWDHNSGGWCEFYEYNDDHGTDSKPKDYQCGFADSGGQQERFKVALWTNQFGAQQYGLYDCGTLGGSTWSNCTKESSGPKVSNLGDVYVVNAQESPYSDSSHTCENYFLGSSSYTTDMSDTEVQVSEGGVWGTQTMTFSSALNNCEHYKSPSHTNSDFETYDDRN